MRRKIFISLLVVVASSAAGAVAAAITMRQTTRTLSGLIQLHQVEELRAHLIIAIQAAQSDLYTVHTSLGQQVDAITDNVLHLADAVEGCSECHHAPAVTARIERLRTMTRGYEDAVSDYITASADGERIARLKRDAAVLGSELLRTTEDMSIQATRRLEAATAAAMDRIDQARVVLWATIGLALLAAMAVAVRLATSITRPIDALVRATRAIAAHDLEASVSIDDGTEFGELATHFNEMSAALRKGYAQLEDQVKERRQAEAALRVSEERLRLALEATSDVVWDWNVATDALYQSPRWARLLGYPVDATPATFAAMRALVHPDDLPVVDAQVRRAKGRSDAIEYEHRVRNASGEWTWMLSRARVVERDPRGAATRIVGTWADVTERKKMVERLQLSERLASVGTLAAGVAHEINNPLAYVLANVAFAMETIDGATGPGAGPADGALAKAMPECRKALAEAQDGAGRVRDIVRDLKVFSRADPERRVPVDVNGAVAGALRIVGDELRHRARLVRDLRDVPPVLADESRLAQVFVNLLVNAAHAIPEGRPDENEIRIATRAGERGSVIVEVADTGRGIPPEQRPRIFDPFFTTRPIGVGTGLGLAVCHGIVTALGGDIEVDSEVGKGSRFRVVLRSAGDRGAREPGGAG